jgi:hypothetical protein
MKRLLTAALAVAVLSGSALAQKPTASKIETKVERTEPSREPPSSLGEVSATPEMWLYEQQLHRHDNPKYAVREKAEFRARQREHRIAAMSWFGMSNLRPMANPDVMHGGYSPQWTGNHPNPMRWSGAATHGVAQPALIDVRRY